MRKVIALTAAAGLLLALAGCTVNAPSGSCEPVAPGDASRAVSATGAFDASPDVEFPTPLTTDTLEVSVLEKGDGATIYAGDFVFLTYTAYDPATGEKAADTASASVVAGRDNDAEKLFECMTVGSRIAAMLPAVDATETSAATATSLLIIDIDKAFTSKATGRVEVPQQGMPSIVTAPDGTPGFTILDEEPPAALKYSTLITGDGKKVEDGDQLLLQFSIVDWSSKSVVDSTWTDDSYPQARRLAKFDSTTGEGLSPAALKALSGATVGSQVLVVMPPSSWAGSDIQATEGSTLVAVYDILAIIE